ncbi:MAG TPA: MerR family transcriptional regulator [Rudaea sp.]|nr:MerR family transcriptional regulator [Rudaea sp.]
MKHSIAAVARMANLSPDVIRSWERRYKIVEPARNASGVRLYSDEDVARLTLAREATRLGHRIRHVAQLSDEQLEELLDRKPAENGANADVVARLLDAMHAHDLATASQILRVAALLVPVRELVLEILAPALREVGRQWDSGELAIWQEHFLSNEVLGVAGTLQRLVAPGPRVVFATPPFERHGFGIGLAALLAAARGVAACNLGVTVPAAQVIAAARQLHAAAVVIGMTQEALPQEEAIEYARQLDAGLPAGVDVMLGGAAGARVAASVPSPRVRSIATLEEFDGLCVQWR